MNNPYDVYSWSTQYREERLSEARARHLEGRLREGCRGRRGQSRLASVLHKALALLGAAVQPGVGRAKSW